MSNISVLDHYVFRAKGALDANSHYVLMASNCCSRQCVVDEEIDRLYFDPSNLGRYIDLAYDSQCPYCSKELLLVAIEELSAVSGEWKWAALER